MTAQQPEIIHNKVLPCPYCGGSPNPECQQCQGQGKIYQPQRFRICYHCAGTGYIFGRPCNVCQTTGELKA
jgi:DnaJ-class molecular chaperone